MDRLAADDGGTPGAGPSLGEVEMPPHAGRMEHLERWADEVIRQAIARGEFDHLSLAGKPIPGLTRHDPDWWLKAYIEREHITGVGPEAFLLRQADAELDARLDREHREADVRDILDEFNHRVVEARRQLFGGPPVVTPTRDVELEVARWRERRAAAAAAHAASAAAAHPRRTASWYRGQFLSRRRASSPAESSDGRSGVTDLP
jgi:hypothetical protein